MKPKTYKWFMIKGYVDPRKDSDRPFVRFVESESARNVIKYHGGMRGQTKQDGERVVIQFPNRESEVQRLWNWDPDRAIDMAGASEDVTIVPATRYKCECGREHTSEYPYPSVWCQCGRKAVRVYASAK